ncbi:MAG: hypothetical protein ACK4GO_12820 [Gemmobacter sp.]
MTARLARLAAVADLMRDRALQELRTAAAARAASRAQLAALDPAPVAAVPEPAHWRNAVLHQAWADSRRTEINMALARQTAAWIVSRDEAARAAGRAAVLEKLRAR